MTDRTRALRRIVTLQGKVAALAEARLGTAERRKAELTADREALQAYVDGANLSGTMALLAMGQTRAIALREVAAETHRIKLRQARQEAETRLKMAERVGKALSEQEAAAAERRDLERLIEDAVARDAQDRERQGEG